MKICFTIDDVIRAKTKQIGEIYKKYIDSSVDLESLDITSDNLYGILEKFDERRDYERFLYEDYVFEIFGKAPVAEKGVDRELNMWLLGLDDLDAEEKVDVMLANPFEFNMSIGYTHFFLSKIATRIRETYFPWDSSDIWGKCDVLVTASPKLIAEKPEGKKVVKIKMPYNKDVEADLEYENLSDMLSDNGFFEKVGLR